MFYIFNSSLSITARYANIKRESYRSCLKWSCCFYLGMFLQLGIYNAKQLAFGPTIRCFIPQHDMLEFIVIIHRCSCRPECSQGSNCWSDKLFDKEVLNKTKRDEVITTSLSKNFKLFLQCQRIILQLTLLIKVEVLFLNVAFFSFNSKTL